MAKDYAARILTDSEQKKLDKITEQERLDKIAEQERLKNRWTGWARERAWTWTRAWALRIREIEDNE